MSSALQIDGKTLHPIKDATKHVSYSRDYITRLARDQKIIATYIGRQWFVDLQSLQNYFETAQLEQEIRKKQLSEERIKELKVREVVERQNRLQTDRAASFHKRALAAASLVLCFGVLSGLAVNHLVPTLRLPGQVASTVDFSLDDTSAPSTESNVTAERKTTATANTVTANNTDRVVTPHFVQDIKKFPLTTEGILLLPLQATGTSAIEDFFSDTVRVRTLAGGGQSAVIVDKDGKQVGREIPLVLVPVTADTNSI